MYIFISILLIILIIIYFNYIYTYEYFYAGKKETKEKLRDYGISPPEKNASCPQSNSKEIELISEFCATACKSMYKCNDCLEPFEHFKCI